MRRTLFAVLTLLTLLFALSAPAFAQGTTPTATQSASNIASYGTVGANILMDSLSVLSAPDKACAAKREALSVGLSIGISELLKLVVKEQRPDASDFKSFPSEHTAIAFATSGWNFSYGITLGIGTGVERVTANKHHWYDVAAGAGIGLGSRYIGGRVFPCAA